MSPNLPAARVWVTVSYNFLFWQSLIIAVKFVIATVTVLFLFTGIRPKGGAEVFIRCNSPFLVLIF